MAEYDPNVDQFDLARKRAAQQVNAGVQTQQDALKRRFAAAGALNSGAAIQSQEDIANKGQDQLSQANEGINAQQNLELQRQKEVKEGREYATGERLGSQAFAAEQAGLGRAFSREERLGSQAFGAGQADLQRAWQTGERLSAQDYQSMQTKLAQELQSSQFGQQMSLALDQFKQQKYVDDENVKLGNKALDQKGWLDSLFGPAAGSVGNLFGSGGGSGSFGRGLSGFGGGGGGFNYI